MRWPWQPKPGYVRVNRKEYIRLLEGALRYHRLEDQIRDHRLDAAGHKAREISNGYPTAEEREIVAGLAAALPLAADGTFHSAAFQAAADAAVWEHRERQLVRLAAGGQEETR